MPTRHRTTRTRSNAKYRTELSKTSYRSILTPKLVDAARKAAIYNADGWVDGPGRVNRGPLAPYRGGMREKSDSIHIDELERAYGRGRMTDRQYDAIFPIYQLMLREEVDRIIHFLKK